VNCLNTDFAMNLKNFNNKRRKYDMPEERGECGCGCNNGCSCNNGGFLGNLFGGCGCGDSTILFFIIIFLLLFTNCGCNR